VATIHFSSRLPESLAPNRLALVRERLRAAGTSILDLTESNPTRIGLDYPADLLQALAQPGGLRYSPHPLGVPAAREAVASEYARRGLQVDPARIVLAASTSEAYSLLFRLLCDPGDVVLAPRPSYPLFEHLARLDAVRLETYLLEYHGAWSVNLATVEDALQPGVRAVLAVNPNNPTGSFLKHEEGRELARLCRERGMALVGDEVFADYAWGADPRRFLSVLEQPETLAFSLGGLSKAAGLPQVKLAWMVVGGPEALVGEAVGRLEVVCDSYLSVATPAQLGLPRLLAAGAAIRSQIAARLRTNLDVLRRCVAASPAVRMLAAEGGWSAVIQVPATRPEEALVIGLLEREHVLVHPGYFFDFPSEAFLIVSLLPRPEVFEEAIGRILAAVGEQ
jgi:alanine-synthesizing transaminase